MSNFDCLKSTGDHIHDLSNCNKGKVFKRILNICSFSDAKQSIIVYLLYLVLVVFVLVVLSVLVLLGGAILIVKCIPISASKLANIVGLYGEDEAAAEAENLALSPP